MQQKNYRALALPSILIALTAAAAGCSRAVDTSRIHAPYTVTVYEKNGTYSPERLIPPDSSQAEAVATWVEAHKSGWSASLVTYVPYRLLRGEGFEFNFQRKICILNYRTGGGWVQVTRAIEESDAPPVFDAP